MASYSKSALPGAFFAVILAKPMSARDIIRQIEALPPEEQREVMAHVDTMKSAMTEKKSGKRMNFKDAKKHVCHERVPRRAEKLAK